MNCKAGDLAVIVRCTSGQEYVLGHVCTVLARADQPCTGAPGWRFEPPTRRGHTCTLDAFMRPIRDPGEDARDELLRPLPDEVAA
jgi:hypothetical protein